MLLLHIKTELQQSRKWKPIGSTVCLKVKNDGGWGGLNIWLGLNRNTSIGNELFNPQTRTTLQQTAARPLLETKNTNLTQFMAVFSIFFSTVCSFLLQSKVLQLYENVFSPGRHTSNTINLKKWQKLNFFDYFFHKNWTNLLRSSWFFWVTAGFTFGPRSSEYFLFYTILFEKTV